MLLVPGSAPAGAPRSVSHSLDWPATCTNRYPMSNANCSYASPPSRRGTACSAPGTRPGASPRSGLGFSREAFLFYFVGILPWRLWIVKTRWEVLRLLVAFLHLRTLPAHAVSFAAPHGEKVRGRPDRHVIRAKDQITTRWQSMSEEVVQEAGWGTCVREKCYLHHRRTGTS